MPRYLTPEQHHMMEQLTGQQLTRTGEPGKILRSWKQSIKMKLPVTDIKLLQAFWQKANDPVIRKQIPKKNP